jgi:hypothetical protein
MRKLICVVVVLFACVAYGAAQDMHGNHHMPASVDPVETQDWAKQRPQPPEWVRSNGTRSK